MSEQDQFAMLRQSASENNRCHNWNLWRKNHPEVHIALAEADLKGLDLVEANLCGANLLRAILTNAVLYEANLEDANLQGASLKEARLGKVFGSDLQAARINRADLSGSDLTKAYLHGVEMRQVCLKKANLHGANLNEADLGGADLTEANLQNATIALASLDGAVLDGIRIYDLRGSAKSAVDIQCRYLDIGETAGMEIVEFNDENAVQEFGLSLAQDPLRRIQFLSNRLQQQRNPLVRLEQIAAKDETLYRIEEKLQEDILWVTYRVKRVRDGRLFLMYVLDLHPAYIAQGSWENLRKRFIIAGLRAKKIRHPHIAGVLDVGYLKLTPLTIGEEVRNRPFWLVENFKGQSLTNWVMSAHPHLLMPIMVKLTSALRYLHHHIPILKRGDFKNQEVEFSELKLMGEGLPTAFVHGNINPGNILVSSDGSDMQMSSPAAIYWQDFTGGFTLHASSDFAGIPAPLLHAYQYMSPEQKRSREYLSARSDIFSLGLVFYYMLTKVHFFGESIPAREEEFIAGLRAIECPRRLQEAILRMVSQDPQQRPFAKQVHDVLQPRIGQKIALAGAAVIAMVLAGLFFYRLAGVFMLDGREEPALQAPETKPVEHEEPATTEPLSTPPAKVEEPIYVLSPEDLATSRNVELRMRAACDQNAPTEVLARLGNDEAEKVRLAVAKNPSAPPEILKKLGDDEVEEIRIAVAKNPSTPPEILKELARSTTSFKIAVAENMKTPAEILKELAGDKEGKVRQAVFEHLQVALGADCRDAAKCILRGDLYNGQGNFEMACQDYQNAVALNPNDSQTHYKLAVALLSLERYAEARQSLNEVIRITPDNLDAYLKCGDACCKLKEYKQAVDNWHYALNAGHPKKEEICRRLRKLAQDREMAADVLARLADVKDSKVRLEVARNSGCPAELLVELSQDPVPNVRAAAVENAGKKARVQIASHADTPTDILERLARDREAEIRTAVARHRSTPGSSLKLLARDREQQVRLAVAGNPLAQAEVLAQMSDEKDSEIRQKLISHPNLPAYIFTQLAQEDWEMLPSLVENAPNRVHKQYTNAEYLGQIKDGEPHGLGSRKWHTGARYIGQFENGKSQGLGIYEWPDGKKYIGQWNNDKMHGRGILNMPDGDQYQGEFVNSQKHGLGIYVWADGRKYEGEYQNNETTGKGIMTWPDGRRYEGEFKQGRPHGKGTETYADGNKYTGEYMDGKPHGTGTYIWASGNKYVGEFLNGKMHGYGTVYRADGTEMKKGVWKSGKFVDK